MLPDPDPFSLAPCSLCQGRFAPAAPMPPHSRAASLTAAARGALPEAGRDEGMVLPIEQRDVVIDLSKPVPVSMTNLLNLTHATSTDMAERPWHVNLTPIGIGPSSSQQPIPAWWKGGPEGRASPLTPLAAKSA